MSAIEQLEIEVSEESDIWYDEQIRPFELALLDRYKKESVKGCCCIAGDGHLECGTWSTQNKSSYCVNDCCWSEVESEDVFCLPNPTCYWTMIAWISGYYVCLMSLLHCVMCLWMGPRAIGRHLWRVEWVELFYSVVCIPFNTGFTLGTGCLRLTVNHIISCCCCCTCTCYGVMLQSLLCCCQLEAYCDERKEEVTQSVSE